MKVKVLTYKLMMEAWEEDGSGSQSQGANDDKNGTISKTLYMMSGK